MVLNNIEKLIEKYENGETSIKEEKQLKAYFNQEEIEPQHEVYRPLFQYFNQTKQEGYTGNVPLKPKKNNLYKWISVAAVAVLMLSIMTQLNFGGQEPSYTDEELMAYNQAKEALNLLSSQFNKSTENVAVLDVVSTNFNKGVERVAYVEEFSVQTNKLLNNN